MMKDMLMNFQYNLYDSRDQRIMEYGLLASFFEGLIGSHCGKDTADCLISDYEKRNFDWLEPYLFECTVFDLRMKYIGSKMATKLSDKNPGPKPSPGRVFQIWPLWSG